MATSSSSRPAAVRDRLHPPLCPASYQVSSEYLIASVSSWSLVLK